MWSSITILKLGPIANCSWLTTQSYHLHLFPTLSFKNIHLSFRTHSLLLESKSVVVDGWDKDTIKMIDKNTMESKIWCISVGDVCMWWY